MRPQVLQPNLQEMVGLVTKVQQVAADMLTVSESQIVLWLGGTEVGRFACDEAASVRFSGRAWTRDDARLQHANAYRTWTAEVNDELVRRHANGESLVDLDSSQRKSGAIQSSLNRLGVVPPSYASVAPAKQRGWHEVP